MNFEEIKTILHKWSEIAFENEYKLLKILLPKESNENLKNNYIIEYVYFNENSVYIVYVDLSTGSHIADTISFGKWIEFLNEIEK